LRLQLGLTQRQLAEEIEVAEFTVWRWEKGHHKIPKIVALGIRKYVEDELAKQR